MKINLPNQLTLARFVLAGVFFTLLSNYDVRHPRPWLLDVCIVVFVVAAATDWLDGYLARKHNQVTALGRMLDPFVDKILVCGAFIFLAGASFRAETGEQVTHVAPWMAVVIVGRELLVTGLRSFAESRGVSFAAKGVGKAKMVLQSITAPALLLFVAHIDPLPVGPNIAWIKTLLVWATVGLTLVSMVPYLIHSRDFLTEAGGS